MNDSVAHDQVMAARAYEELLVPALFQQWPTWVLDTVQIEPGQRVLDVACGTGVLGRAAADRVRPAGFVAGIDPDPGMLAVAAELAPAVEWRLARAESLPYPHRSFDVVVSQFGLMFFTDRALAVREMLRVLVPGGMLGVVVWDRLENVPGYHTEVDLLESLAGKQAADAVRAPFALGDAQQLAGLFERAGATVQVTTRTGTARFPSIRSMVEADLRGWLPIMGVVLEEGQIERILQEAEYALARYVHRDGQVVFDAPAHIITGKRQ